MTFSNLVDTERFVEDAEKATNFTFLNKVDLSFLLRDEVVEHLHYIGITPATMFPGLDGTCKAFNTRNGSARK